MEYLLGGVVAAIATWYATSRRFSGKIESTEAKDLWAESASIRAWSAGRIEALEGENRELRERVAVLEDRLARYER